jgi:hypothetical protein
MLKGSANLTLLTGLVVHSPVPQEVLDALQSIQVTTPDVGPATFQMAFTISNQSPLQILFLLSGGVPLLFLRMIVVMTVGGSSEVVLDGVITHHEITPGTDNAHCTLTITGEDLTALMNQIDFSGFPFPALPAEARVAICIAKYSMLGIVPMVIPSILIDVPLPIDLIPSQQGTDLAYIKSLADDVGYVFYISAGPAPGANIAYWGPQIKVGAPQSALNLDMDAGTNVESLSFKFDSQQNKIPIVFYYNQQTGIPIPIPIPPITPLNPPLGAIPPLPTSFTDLKPVDDNLAKYSFPRSLMIGLAKASQWADAVTADGTLDVVRYGQTLKSRQLVGVRGAGPAFDGLYYVKSVTHNIKPGEYKQSFKLSRNGLVSTVSTVPA